jgi:thioredoxin-related protein
MKRGQSINWRASLWLLAAALSACSGSSSPVKANWLTDYNQARQEAKSQNRPILMEFTASDWSEPCQKMSKDVLDTEPFKEFADKNLVLFQADFTRDPPPSGQIAQQNQQLLGQLAKVAGPITAYPTFVLVDSNGGIIAQRIVGWMPGEQFLNNVSSAIGQPPYAH